MKIVDLNNYEENDGLRDKLRQRMDAHEPELSDSVWDRINHQMDRREANRKKRFLWWFSSVAVVLLTSGIITYLALNKAEQPKTIAQNTNEIIITSPNNPNVKLGTVTPAENNEGAAENNGTPSTNSGDAENQTIINNTTIQLPPPPPPFVAPTTTDEQPIAPNNDNGTQKNNTEKLEKLETKNPDAAETFFEGTTKGKKEKLETKEHTQTDNTPTTDGEAKKKASKKGSKAESNALSSKTKWFVGVNFGVNQTYRTVTDINSKFYYPTAKDRNKYEKRSYSTAYGLELGFYPTKNFFIKSGIGILNLSENVRYDIKMRNDSDNRASPPDNYNDSIAPGNSINKQNTYKYIQIPFEIGYSRNITKRWSLFCSGGISYNILQDYDYYFYEPIYGSEITRSDKLEYNNMFKNYIMVSGGFGGQYKIANRCFATLGINYRRAITSSANTEYEVNVKPYTLGATTGIAFRF
jgi:hypothetical protein